MIHHLGEIRVYSVFVRCSQYYACCSIVCDSELVIFLAALQNI